MYEYNEVKKLAGYLIQKTETIPFFFHIRSQEKIVNKYVVMNEIKKTIGKRKIEEDKAIYFDYKSEESQARMFMKKYCFSFFICVSSNSASDSFYSSMYFKYLFTFSLVLFYFHNELVNSLQWQFSVIVI